MKNKSYINKNIIKSEEQETSQSSQKKKGKKKLASQGSLLVPEELHGIVRTFHWNELVQWFGFGFPFEAMP